MGGIPTNVDGQVVLDENITRLFGDSTLPENALASPFTGQIGLAQNSLVDILVFGRRAGLHMAEFLQGSRLRSAAIQSRPSHRHDD
jgi:succinate dehydrogenase / fumarate reductase flavoprotein subunit